VLHGFTIIVRYALLQVDCFDARSGAVRDGFGASAVDNDLIEARAWGAFGFRVQPADRVRDGVAGENFSAIERGAKPEKEAFVFVVGVVGDGGMVFALIVPFENIENGHRARVFVCEFVFFLACNYVNACACVYRCAFIDVFQRGAKCGGASRCGEARSVVDKLCLYAGNELGEGVGHGGYPIAENGDTAVSL